MGMSFFSQSEIVPIRTQRVPQNIETGVTFTPVPGAYVRFAYSRSSESMASQIEGQDYLCFRHNDQRFAGVVCDGVGSSFCGNLAARILGDNLLDWFWGLDIAYVGRPEALGESATAYLNKLQKQAQIEVEEYEIPGEITGLIRQALESQRDYGSEAIFAAVRIDHPSAMIPDGLVSILWMGDTTIRALNHEGRDHDLGGDFANANRWSTVRGARGEMGVWMNSLKEVGRVLAHTDGLSAHADQLQAYSDDHLDREIRAGSRLPTSDDVAFLDVVLRSPQYEGHPDPDLPDPNAERPVLEPIWNPTGAPEYELKWTWEGKKARFLIQEASTPALTDARTFEAQGDSNTWRPYSTQKPGNYYYRVRAIPRWGAMTPWSELRETHVAYPVPGQPVLTVNEVGTSTELTWAVEGESLDYVLERATDIEFIDGEHVYEGRGTSWTVQSAHLEPGTVFFRVRAISDGGEGPWSATQEVTIRVPPPARPHLGGISYDGLNGYYLLRWQGAPGATHYEVQTVLDGEEASINRVDETQAALLDLIPGSYEFAVRACHQYGCSEWSIPQALTVTPPAPDAAPDLTLTGPDDAGVIDLTWDEVPHAAEYLLEIAETPDFASARMQSLKQTRFKVSRREPGALHFRVAAENAGGTGPWSNVEQVAITPPAPAWVEAALSDDGATVNLAWGGVGGRVTYFVAAARVDASDKETEVYRGDETGVSATLPGGAGLIVFKVRAELPGIHSDWVTTDPIQAPSDLTAPNLLDPVKQDEGAYKLSWTPVPAAAHYEIEVSQTPGFEAVLRSIKVEGVSATFKPGAGNTYYVRVMARRDGEVSPPSNVAQVQTAAPARPMLWPVDAVTALARFTLKWSGVPGTDHYDLEESIAPDFNKRQTRSWSIKHPEQVFEHPGLQAGTYHYRVRAVKPGEDPGAWSDILTLDVQ